MTIRTLKILQLKVYLTILYSSIFNDLKMFSAEFFQPVVDLVFFIIWSILLNNKKKGVKQTKIRRYLLSYSGNELKEIHKIKANLYFKTRQLPNNSLNDLNFAIHYVIKTCNSIFIDEDFKVPNFFVLSSSLEHKNLVSLYIVLRNVNNQILFLAQPCQI